MNVRHFRLLSLLLLAAAPGAACDQNAPLAQQKKADQKAAGDTATELYQVPLGDSPGRGGAEPEVTMVAFSEFECPFCARVAPVLDQVVKTYGEDVRIVWKHLPLP